MSPTSGSKESESVRAPKLGDHVLTLKFTSFSGLKSRALEAAREALKGEPNIIPSVLQVDHKAGTIVVKCQGGNFVASKLSSKLSKAGFKMQSGIKFGTFTR